MGDLAWWGFPKRWQEPQELVNRSFFLYRKHQQQANHGHHPKRGYLFDQLKAFHGFHIDSMCRGELPCTPQMARLALPAVPSEDWVKFSENKNENSQTTTTLHYTSDRIAVDEAGLSPQAVGTLCEAGTGCVWLTIKPPPEAQQNQSKGSNHLDHQMKNKSTSSNTKRPCRPSTSTFIVNESRGHSCERAGGVTLERDAHKASGFGMFFSPDSWKL